MGRGTRRRGTAAGSRSVASEPPAETRNITLNAELAHRAKDVDCPSDEPQPKSGSERLRASASIPR